MHTGSHHAEPPKENGCYWEEESEVVGKNQSVKARAVNKILDSAYHQRSRPRRLRIAVPLILEPCIPQVQASGLAALGGFWINGNTTISLGGRPRLHSQPSRRPHLLHVEVHHDTTAIS